MSRTGDLVMDELEKTAKFTGTESEFYLKWLRASREGVTLDKFIYEEKRTKRKRPHPKK